MNSLRILTCCYYRYYGSANAIEPQFYYLHRVPQSMGHEVDFFDYPIALEIGAEHMHRQLVRLVRGGEYDVVFVATHREEFGQELLGEIRKHCPVIAWNSDDEWRWNDYSSIRAGWYSYMVTNSPDVYAANKPAYPNLIHAQWACCGFWDGRQTPKTIDFSFVGQVYGSRAAEISRLREKAGLVAYGKGAGIVYSGGAGTPLRERLKRRIQSAILRRVAPSAFAEKSTISFDKVNELWNHSLVSFTPLENSAGGTLQIKSRVMDMGLSGTVMLAPRGAGVERYYEPGREFVEYENLDDCAEQARRLIKDRARCTEIGQAYANRTLTEHMWRHRIEHVLKESGLQ